MKALDRFLLATVLVVSCLALSSYHRATRTITLSTTLRDSSGNSTAHVLVWHSESGGALGLGANQRELEVHVVAGGGGGGELSGPGGGTTGGPGAAAPQPRVLLRYTACTGLINQQYSHIAAFALAAVLRADVVLPPAACRGSFGQYFHTKKDRNNMTWSPIPTDSILDVERITEVWGRHGIRVHKPPQLEPFPDLTEPQSAFPVYTGQPYDPRGVVRLEGIYLKPRELWELVGMARAAIANATRALAAAGGSEQQQQQQQQPKGGSAGGAKGGGGEAVAQQGQQERLVVLDLPCTFFSLKTTTSIPLVSKVALSLSFNPHLRAIADRVVGLLTNGGRHPYNGVHLRVEKDAQDWVKIMGGVGQIWHLYLLAMRDAGFDRGSELYVATGLLSYGAGEEWDFTERLFIGRGLASRVHCKEQFVPEFELAGLNSEQMALLDFLILSRAQRFVGFGSSTFSYYLREFRALHGVPKSSSLLINSSRIGTDKLFAAAAVVAPDWEAEAARGGGVLGWLHRLVGGGGGPAAALRLR